MALVVGSRSSVYRVSTMRQYKSYKHTGGRCSSLRCRAEGVMLAKERIGTHTQKGTVRKQNEDRFVHLLSPQPAGEGEVAGVACVFDGHGGSATAEWLEENFMRVFGSEWEQKQPEYAARSAYLAADKELLSPKGFMGMGERGYGGSKCGSTAASAVVFVDEGKPKILSANAGDARILLIRKGGCEQLSIDHVPDNEDERKRIEATNPTPRIPLVRYVGGTWRLGGLLALSRALGDAYLKPSGLFEGIDGGIDDYSSGFGLSPLPHVAVVDVEEDAEFIIVASDGIYSNPERGGGGGLENSKVGELVHNQMSTLGVEGMARKIAEEAMASGSTDDITIVILDIREVAKNVAKNAREEEVEV